MFSPRPMGVLLSMLFEYGSSVNKSKDLVIDDDQYIDAIKCYTLGLSRSTLLFEHGAP